MQEEYKKIQQRFENSKMQMTKDNSKYVPLYPINSKIKQLSVIFKKLLPELSYLLNIRHLHVDNNLELLMMT